MNTTTAENDLSNYDDTGAMIYIIIVLLWYSIGIIFMLGMQMRPRSEIIEESARRKTKIVIENLRSHSHTKEILEELVDKKKRARLWDIYLGTKSSSKEKLHRADTVRIRHIEKQLASINRTRRLTNESLFPTDEDTRYNCSHSKSRQVKFEDLPSARPSTLRRRSSFDQQTLERWTALAANQPKTSEQVPWYIHKPMIRNYFRRNLKRPLSIVRQESTSPPSSAQIDNFSLFTDHISNLTRHRSESNLEEFLSNVERQNPYITYFYRPTNRSNILTSEFFPASSEHSFS